MRQARLSVSGLLCRSFNNVLCSLIHIFMAHNSWEVVKTSLIAESRCVVSTNARSFGSFHVTRVYNVEEQRRRSAHRVRRDEESDPLSHELSVKHQNELHRSINNKKAAELRIYCAVIRHNRDSAVTATKKVKCVK